MIVHDYRPRGGLLKKFLIVGSVLGVIVAGLVGKLVYDYSSGLGPVGDPSVSAIIRVEQGDTGSSVGDKLEAAGLLKSRRSYNIYLRLSGAGGGFKQGSYVFSGDNNVEQMVNSMVDGRVSTRTVTIVPGKRLDQIRDDLVAKEGFDPDAIDEAFNSVAADYAFDDNAELRLEGLLMPETYKLDYGATEADVVARAVQELESQITQEMVEGFNKYGLSVRGAVILASIVQLEHSDPEHQRKIAGVFLNRIESGETLGADPTFRYASFLEGVPDDVDIVNPYNTRIYDGLPPGPISNFNLSALQAVADPIKTNDIFFVAGDDGQVYYNDNLADHERDAAEHCVELCQL